MAKKYYGYKRTDISNKWCNLEIKAIENLLKVHEAQILNYLKATSLKIGLLVNFKHPKAEIKRFIL